MVAFRPATIGMVERVHRLAMPVGKSECASDRTRRAAQAASGIYGSGWASWQHHHDHWRTALRERAISNGSDALHRTVVPRQRCTNAPLMPVLAPAAVREGASVSPEACLGRDRSGLDCRARVFVSYPRFGWTLPCVPGRKLIG